MSRPSMLDGGPYDDAPEPGGFEIDFRVLWVILRRNLLLIGSIVAAALVLGLVVTMLMTPRYTAQASMQIDQEADQVMGTDEAVQPAVSYQDAERFLQQKADVVKSRAMAERVAQALGLFADTRFFDKLALSPPDQIGRAHV